MTKWGRSSNSEDILRHDFLWRPEIPARHAAFPVDKVTIAAEKLANKAFFPQYKLSTADISEVLGNGSRSMVTSASAGYYYSVLHRDRFAPGKKDTESVIDDVYQKVTELIEFVGNQASTEADISQFVVERESVYACRLLERRAVSESPKLRSVYGVSYACNIILGMLSMPFKEFVLGGTRHPMMVNLDPLSFGQHMQGLLGDSTVTPISCDIGKCDKKVTVLYATTVLVELHSMLLLQLGDT